MLCFIFNDTATTEIYTLSLHDALPIGRQVNEEVGTMSLSPSSVRPRCLLRLLSLPWRSWLLGVLGAYQTAQPAGPNRRCLRSEEHTSELQSRQYLVCRLLLEKKK